MALEALSSGVPARNSPPSVEPLPAESRQLLFRTESPCAAEPPEDSRAQSRLKSQHWARLVSPGSRTGPIFCLTSCSSDRRDDGATDASLAAKKGRSRPAAGIYFAAPMLLVPSRRTARPAIAANALKAVRLNGEGPRPGTPESKEQGSAQREGISRSGCFTGFSAAASGRQGTPGMWNEQKSNRCARCGAHPQSG